MTEPLTPEDAAVLRMLAGAHFLGGSVTLPSGRTIGPDEAQALTSAYAPALGEEPPEKPAEHPSKPSKPTTARAPHAGPAPLDLYLSGGGDPGNERTMALMREASRNYEPPAPSPDPHQHRDGIPWHNAPIPHRWHRCKTWTTGSTRNLALVERCACGAIRLDGEGHPWMDRNSRRKPR